MSKELDLQILSERSHSRPASTANRDEKMRMHRPRMVKKLKLLKDRQFVELRCKLAEAPENVR